jgi:hypothetical protein
MQCATLRSAAIRALPAAAAAFAVFAADPGVAEAKKRSRIDPALFRKPLVLTSFAQADRTDVLRNEWLTFKFSAVVKKSSLDARSLRVLQQTGAGTKPAIGALVPRANVVRFDPTRSQRNYDDSRRPNSRIVHGDNPLGFGSFCDYIVQVPGPSELRALRNARGAPIRQGFSSTFRTNGTYSDPVPGQPSFVGDGGNGNLGFEPPRSSATGLVDEDAVIRLEFSEPIDIASLDPSSTVLVTRVRLNEPVPGFIRLDANDRTARIFEFVPSFGFGSDLDNEAGWDVQVILVGDDPTTPAIEGIRDLAGNPLKRGYTSPVFRTRFVAGKKSASVISETFSNQLRMDPVTVTDGGEWNTLERGALLGGAATSYPDADVCYWLNPPAGVTVTFTRQNDPIVADTAQAGCVASRPTGSRGQFLFVPADVGERAAIVSMGWGPSSNATFGSSHQEITLRLGHTSSTALVADFASNINVGNPVQVYKGPYDIPQVKNIQPTDLPLTNGVSRDPPAPPPAQPPWGVPKGYWPWPAFTTPFEWNGTNNLVFDAACLPGPTCQIIRGSFVPGATPFPNRRAIGADYQGGTATFAVDPVILDMRIQKRRRTTYATSLWYELPSESAQFGAPIVSPVAQPGGVVVSVELEGAPGKADPVNPGGQIPNTALATGWVPVTDVSTIDGHRFFRFRVSMVSNLNTGQSARVTSIQFPYQF